MLNIVDMLHILYIQNIQEAWWYFFDVNKIYDIIKLF